MTLCVNQIIEWLAPEDVSAVSAVERILWIDPSASQIATIELTEQRALPRLHRYDEVVSALDTGAARVATVDPSAGRLLPEQEIPESHRRRRDEAWELIAPLVADRDPEIMLSRKRRGKLVAEIAVRSGRNKSSIYGLLQQYWKGGGTKNALLPNFDRCGGRGKRRLADSPRAGPKRGSPKKYSAAAGQSEGINITADIERRFERGIKRFYETSDRLSLSQAFQRNWRPSFIAVSQSSMARRRPSCRQPTICPLNASSGIGMSGRIGTCGEKRSPDTESATISCEAAKCSAIPHGWPSARDHSIKSMRLPRTSTWSVRSTARGLLVVQ
jgi:putative transposase